MLCVLRCRMFFPLRFCFQPFVDLSHHALCALLLTQCCCYNYTVTAFYAHYFRFSIYSFHVSIHLFLFFIFVHFPSSFKCVCFVYLFVCFSFRACSAHSISATSHHNFFSLVKHLYVCVCVLCT